MSVDLELRDGVLWARINRPRTGNACSSEVLAGLEGWLSRAGEEDVCAAVLTGTGGVFCAGADVREAAALLDDREALLAYLRRGFELVKAIGAAPVPVVAAVNGAAFAGGLELVQACDIAIAARSATLGDRHARHGQIPGWGSSAMLPPIVGAKRAARLLLTGEDLTAAEAERIGLLTEVAGDLEPRAQELALLAADASPRLLALTRAHDLDAAREREWAALVEHTRQIGKHHWVVTKVVTA